MNDVLYNKDGKEIIRFKDIKGDYIYHLYTEKIDFEGTKYKEISHILNWSKSSDSVLINILENYDLKEKK